MTLAELAELYLQAKRTQVPPLKAYESLERRVYAIVRAMGDLPLAELSTARVEAYKAFRGHNPNGGADTVSYSTVNRELARLKSLLRWGIENRLFSYDMMPVIKMLPENLPRTRTCSPREYLDLLEVSHYPLRGMIILAYNTGMRRGEIARLRWDQIDLGARIITLHAEDTKTRTGRNIPLEVPVRDYLAQLERVGDYVFQYDGKPIYFTEPCRKAWTTARKKIGAPDLHFHDFRHTFVTRKRKAGVHDHVIMSIVGHKTDSMFRRYDSVDYDDLMAAVG